MTPTQKALRRRVMEKLEDALPGWDVEAEGFSVLVRKGVTRAQLDLSNLYLALRQKPLESDKLIERAVAEFEKTVLKILDDRASETGEDDLLIKVHVNPVRPIRRASKAS